MNVDVVKPFGSCMVEDRRAFEALLQPLRDAGGGHVVGVAVLAPSRVLFADGALRAAGEETEGGGGKGGGGGEGDGPGGGEEARGELSSSATHRQSLLVLSRVFDALAASRGDDADRAEVSVQKFASNLPIWRPEGNFPNLQIFGWSKFALNLP